MARVQGKKDEKTKVSADSWKKAGRIFSYLKEYRWRFAFGLALLFASSITTLIVPRLMGQMAGIGIPSGTSSDWSIDFGALSLDMMNLNTVALVLFGIFLLQALISFLKVYVFSFVTEHMMRDLRKDVFAHMIRLPMSFFVEQRVGDLNSRISADIASIQETFNITLSEFIRQIIIIILGVGFLFYSSPSLTFVMLITLPIIMIVAVIFGRFIRKLSRKTQDLVAESNVVVQESLTGIVNVKSFTNEFFETLKYATNVNEVKKIAIKSGVWRGLFSAFIIIFIFGAIGLVILQGAKLMELPATDPDHLDPALFFSFLLYTVMIAASFGGIANQYSAI
jgi:ABC-type multidrug transport system fused ATPase/permease subunit